MKTSKLFFVVYRHDARTFHFDFRIQIGEGMSSWEIPKGPTLDPTVKRLAVQTTEFKHQEKYGKGPEILWDKGTYIPEVEVSRLAGRESKRAKGVREEIKDLEEGQKVMEEGFKKGEIKFFLKGKKLKGSFALVKTKGFPPGIKNAWLLIKHKDEYVKLEKN